MYWQDVALAVAGVIGSLVAIVHGVLVQRLMVRPIAAFPVSGKPMPASVRRMVPLLLHFSTISWFLGGLALIAAAAWFGQGAKLATSLLVGALYMFGATGNLWATRGRHPGWILMGAALALILVGIG